MDVCAHQERQEQRYYIQGESDLDGGQEVGGESEMDQACEQDMQKCPSEPV